MLSLKVGFSSHWKALSLTVVLFLAIVSSVYAYLKWSSPQAGPHVTVTSPPLQFSMELDKVEYQYEENITVKFCLRNISNQTITIGKSYLAPVDPIFTYLSTEAQGVDTRPGHTHFISGLFHFGFSIKDENGTEVHRWVQGMFPMVYDLYIEPNGYVKQTLILGYEFAAGQPFLPRGTYQIIGILYKIGITGVGISPISGTFETPSITFTIR